MIQNHTAAPPQGGKTLWIAKHDLKFTKTSLEMQDPKVCKLEICSLAETCWTSVVYMLICKLQLSALRNTWSVLVWHYVKLETVIFCM